MVGPDSLVSVALRPNSHEAPGAYNRDLEEDESWASVDLIHLLRSADWWQR